MQPKLNPLQKREAAMNAISSIARRQVVGKTGQAIGRKKVLRRAEETRLIKRNVPLRNAFRRLQRSTLTNAGTAMRIRRILKNVRSKMRSPEGLEVKMRSGRRYKLSESIAVHKGRLGIKQASRKAVREEAEFVQEQQEELVEREQEHTQEGALSAGEKRRQEAKEKQSEWRKGEFEGAEESQSHGTEIRTSALSGTTEVSIGEHDENHAVSMNDDEPDDLDSSDGPQDMPIA